MEKTFNDQKPIEQPTGNMVISMKEIKSFTGNKSINSIETLVDEAFRSFNTISVENDTKRYQSSDKQELIAHIKQLQTCKKKKKTFILILLLLFVISGISLLLTSCNSAYNKETDEYITNCVQYLNRDDLKKCEKSLNFIKERKLTKKQINTVRQIESQINDIKKQIAKEEQEKAEEERKAREQMEREMKAWEEEVMDEAYRMGRKRGYISGNDPHCPWYDKERILNKDMTTMSNNFYNSNRDASFFRKKPNALPKAVDKYKRGFKDGFEEGWMMSH